MQRFWSVLAVQMGKHAGVVLGVGLALTIVLGVGITQLEFETGQDSYLNADEVTYTDNVDYQNLFGGQAMLSSVRMQDGHTVDELFTDDHIAQFVALEEELMATGRFVGVITPVTAMQYSDNLVGSESGDPTESVAGKILLDALEREPDPAGKEIRGEDSVATLLRVNEVPFEEQVLGNPAWNDILLRDNAGAVRKSHQPFIIDDVQALIIVRLNGNQDIETEGESSVIVNEAIERLDIEGATITTTGAPVILKSLNDYLRGGMLTLGGIAVAIMAGILLLLFDVRWRLLPLLVVMVGIVWAFGLAGYLGIPLTVVTIAALPVMLGMGIDYAIQMHSRIEEEVIIDRARHPIQESARKLGPALLVVTFDAIFAFVALRFAKVPMIRDFGLLLAVGVAAICLCSILTPLAALGLREFRSPTKGRDYRSGVAGRGVVWLGSLPTWTALPLAVVSLGIFAGGVLVEDKLELQTDVIKWVNQDSDEIRDFQQVEGEVGSSAEIGVFVQSDDLFTDEFAQYIHDFTRDTLEENPDDLVLVSSLETLVAYLIELDGTSDLAPTGADLQAAYEQAPPSIAAAAIADDATAFNIVFLTAPGSLDERAPLVRELRDETDPPDGVSLTPSGLAVVGVGLVDNLESNRILLTYLSIAFVGAFLAIRLRSLLRSLLSLVPVLIAVGAASLAAYVSGFELSPMTAVGGPLVVALCTEFTSLILLRFVEERQRGLSPKEAADVAGERTGRAFVVSALTGIAGVGVLATSSLPLLRDFGLIVAINVAVALVSALVVLPPLLVAAEERGWVTRGLKAPADEPFVDTPEPAN